ncbi:hypothetical protein PQR75_14775 [Paraburkholderia fungorum]|uniref:hypothetical protein n=1 Tax=Paraburkholderia fungorum TaxID=134537 RepID=UPI0038B7FAB6
MTRFSPVMVWRMMFRSALALLIGIASGASRADDCGCYARCGGNAQCAQNCASSCQLNANIARQREDIQSEIKKDMQTIVPAYVRARDRLHNTPPTAPNFEEVFYAYQDARIKRDNALLGQYVAAGSNYIAELLTGGQSFKILDDAYQMPEFARPSFHSFVRAQATQMLNAPTGRGYAGNTSNYPSMLDQAELNVWPAQHGGPVPKVVFGHLVVPQKGDPKPLDELSASDRSAVKACNDQVNTSFPMTDRRDRELRQKRQAMMKECVTRTCQSCDY